MASHLPLCTNVRGRKVLSQMPSGPQFVDWRYHKRRDPFEGMPTDNPQSDSSQSMDSPENRRYLVPAPMEGLRDPGPGSIGDADGDERIDVPQDEQKELKDHLPETPDARHQDFIVDITEYGPQPVHKPKRTHTVYDSQQDELMLEDSSSNDFTDTYPFATAIRLSSFVRRADRSAWILRDGKPVWINWGEHAQMVWKDPAMFGLSDMPPNPAGKPFQGVRDLEAGDSQITDMAVNAGNIRYDSSNRRFYFSVPDLTPEHIERVQQFLLNYENSYARGEVNVGSPVSNALITMNMDDFVTSRPEQVLRQRKGIKTRLALLQVLRAVELDPQTAELINQYKNGNVDAGQALITQNLNFITDAVKRRAYRFSGVPVVTQVDLEDLMQEAQIALLSAIQHYDGQQELSKYLWSHIDGVVANELKHLMLRRKRTNTFETMRMPSEVDETGPMSRIVEHLPKLFEIADNAPEQLQTWVPYFVKHFKDGLTYVDMGKEEGAPSDTIIRRGVNQIIEWLREQPEVQDLAEVS